MNKRRIYITLVILVSVFLLYEVYDIAFDSKKEVDNSYTEKFVYDEFYYSYDSETHSKYESKFRNYTGNNAIWDINCIKDTEVDVSLNVDLEKGKLKVILVNSNGTNIEISNSRVVNINQGGYKLKIISEGSIGTIKIGIDMNEYIELIPYFRYVDNKGK